VLLFLVVVATTMRYIHVGSFRFPDAARHAMDGVFVMDTIRDAGYLDPVAYGEAYYARYPCLGFPYHYPPFFAMVEAVFFALFGVSVEVARLSVVFFAVLSVWILFEIVKKPFGRGVAFVSALLLSTAPVVLDWSNRVMLEAPTTCMMLLSSWLVLRYAERPSGWRAMWWALALICSVMSKQTAVFIIAAHAGFLIWRMGWRVCFRREILISAAVVGGVVGAYAAFSAKNATYLAKTVTVGSQAEGIQLEHYLYYFQTLPTVLGIPMFSALCVGLVFLAVRRFRVPGMGVHVAWILGFYAMMFCLLNSRGDRYAFFLVPPLAVIAAFGIVELCRVLRHPALRAAVVLLVFTPIAIHAATWRPPTVEGYKSSAYYVAGLEGGSSVLFDGHWDGDFVFLARQHDESERLVLRGSKILYAFASFKRFGFQSHVESEEDIVAKLGAYGIRYIIIENPDPTDTEEGAMLRELVSEDDRFRHCATFPIERSGIAWPAENISVYEYLEAGEPNADHIEIHFPGLGGRVIRVPIRSDK